MRALIFILSLFLTGFYSAAQETAETYRDDIPVIFIDGMSSLHILSPEPIRYVDISSHDVVGDLSDSKVLRLKYLIDTMSMDHRGADAPVVVTIIGESFIAQYNLRFLRGVSSNKIASRYHILPAHTQQIGTQVDVTTPELHRHAIALLAMRRAVPIRKASDYGIRAELGNVYTVGDFVLLDLTFKNASKLAYEIDELRFKIEDKKITKATNVQSIEIKPIWQLYPHGSFKRQFRNIYVLKKATFPDNKVLHVELSEKQLSGRSVALKIKYGDILKADTF